MMLQTSAIVAFLVAIVLTGFLRQVSKSRIAWVVIPSLPKTRRGMLEAAKVLQLSCKERPVIENRKSLR